jgi:hypothetical protein
MSLGIIVGGQSEMDIVTPMGSTSKVQRNINLKTPQTENKLDPNNLFRHEIGLVDKNFKRFESDKFGEKDQLLEIIEREKNDYTEQLGELKLK